MLLVNKYTLQWDPKLIQKYIHWKYFQWNFIFSRRTGFILELFAMKEIIAEILDLHWFFFVMKWQTISRQRYNIVKKYIYIIFHASTANISQYIENRGINVQILFCDLEWFGSCICPDYFNAGMRVCITFYVCITICNISKCI